MKRVITPLVLVVLASACDAIETPVIIKGVSAPKASGTGCSFDPKSDKYLYKIALDVARSYKLILPLAVDNNLVTRLMNIGGAAEAIEAEIPNSVTPLRFELSWECDSSAFTSDLGPLVVPTFHPNRNFCLDRRETGGDFAGFDIVPVDAAPIPAGEPGLAIVKAVPFQLGAAFADTFRIAKLADDCCRKTAGCQGTDNSVASCFELDGLFASIDPTGSFGLSVQTTQQGRPSEDLVRFRPFAIFHGDYWLDVDPLSHRSDYGADYPLKLRGQLEVVTGDGYSLTSSQLVQEVGLCMNCGPYNGTTRDPKLTDACLYF